MSVQGQTVFNFSHVHQSVSFPHMILTSNYFKTVKALALTKHNNKINIYFFDFKFNPISLITRVLKVIFYLFAGGELERHLWARACLREESAPKLRWR